MRVSREEALESKKRITQEAARLMRENGIARTSVADVMGAAGMTSGGFYKHFASKDELAASAVRAAFEGILSSLRCDAQKVGTAAARADYFRHYLSDAHVRSPGKGCPVAAIGTDAGRDAKLLGPEFARGVEDTLELLGGGKMSSDARAALIRQMSMLVGSIILARAVGEGQVRQEILAAARSSQGET
jgi:TetR/AcrR family transcriptional repressor of nem operon